jgi:hypothetical protein
VQLTTPPSILIKKCGGKLIRQGTGSLILGHPQKEVFVKISLYAVYDRIAEESGPIFGAKNDAVAVRNFRNYTAEVKPDEYKLYCVGEYDNDRIMIFGLDGKAREIVVPELVIRKE